MTEIETERLIIRSFTPDDWEGFQALAIDKETYKRDPRDYTYPTSDDKCREAVEYLAGATDKFFAVCLKKDRKIIGLFAFNDLDANKQLDIGHQFISHHQNNDLDLEALEAIIGFAFERDIESIETRNNPEWAEQLAPLKSLGFMPIMGDLGHLGMTKAVWAGRKQI